MANPQQPELHRSGYGETTQDAQKLRAAERDNAESGTEAAGPTPGGNVSEDARRSGTGSAESRAQKGKT